MKKISIIIVLFLCFFTVKTCEAIPFFSGNLPIKGKITDAETGDPVKDAIILVKWELATASPGGRSAGDIVQMQVCRSDNQGIFKTKGWMGRMLDNRYIFLLCFETQEEPEFYIFKNGYKPGVFNRLDEGYKPNFILHKTKTPWDIGDEEFVFEDLHSDINMRRLKPKHDEYKKIIDEVQAEVGKYVKRNKQDMEENLSRKDSLGFDESLLKRPDVLITTDDFRILEKMQQYGADPNSRFSKKSLKDVIVEPVMVSDMTTVDLTVVQKYKPHMIDAVTPLMVHAALGNVECMRNLIDNGADVNAVDSEGNTALMHVFSGILNDRPIPFFKATALLVGNGADLNAVNDKGESVFFCALKKGSGPETRKALKFLVDNGADINVVPGGAEKTDETADGAEAAATFRKPLPLSRQEYQSIYKKYNADVGNLNAKKMLIVNVVSFADPMHELQTKELVKIYNQYHKYGVNVLSIYVYGETQEDVERIIAEYKVPYQVYIGAEGFNREARFNKVTKTSVYGVRTPRSEFLTKAYFDSKVKKYAHLNPLEKLGTLTRKLSWEFELDFEK